MSLTHQVISSLKWTAGMRLLAQAVTWSVTLVVMRLLSPADYGLMALSSVAVTLLMLVAELGLGAAVVQARELEEQILHRVFGVVLMINAVIILALWGLAPLLALVMAEPRLTPIVRVLALQFLPMALAVVPEALLKRDMRFRVIALIEFGGALVGAAAGLALALAGAGVWTLVLVTLIMVSWRAAGANLMAPSRYRPQFSWRGMRRHVAFGGHVTAAGVLWFLFNEADVFLAGWMLGTQAVGFYSISKQVASLPMQRVSQILNQVLYPAFARLQGEPARAAEQLLRAIQLLGFVIVPLAWGISCVAPEVVLVLLGPKWGPSILPLQIIGLVIPFRLISGFTYTVAQSMGRADIVFRNSLVSALVMPAAFLVGGQYGLVGLSWTWVLVYPWVLAFNVRHSAAVVGLRARDVIVAVLPAVAVGSAMYAAVSILRGLLVSMTGGARLALLVACGAVMYAGLSLLLQRRPIREVTRLIRPHAAPVRGTLEASAAS